MSNNIQKAIINTVSWQCPSNIALVKYWGKTKPQLPINPSISMTLNKACTTTKVSLTKKQMLSDDAKLENISFDFYLNRKEKNIFKPKLQIFFKRVLNDFPWLSSYHLIIESSNTFPHSAGIASSASALSALALCLCSLDPEISKCEDSIFKTKASEVARLGSGSACRSIYADFVLWGNTQLVDNSSNIHAVPLTNIHSNFSQVKDAILIVDDGKKKISSTHGHQLMDHHPFKVGRIEQANNNTTKLLKALTDGKWQEFIQVVEEEALTLHSLMMSSNPGYILLNCESIKLIQAIRNFREKKDVNCCFTIDAGPNIHFLYDGVKKHVVQQFINEELIRYCDVVKVIYDGIGKGPQSLI